MNRTLKLAFGAVLGAALMVPAVAQDQFPDVPENHWVFQALLNMRNEGILVGYPDGFYRGGRPASRYELAGAINAAYQRLRGMIDGHTSQIAALEQRIRAMETAGGPDVDALRRELQQLRADLDAMRRWGDDIAALRRMAETFERDLAGLGVDVEAMRRDLADLQDRVGRLEAVRPAVDIHGDVNLVLHAGHSTDGVHGITVDGRPTGFGQGDQFGDPVGMDRDLVVGHEAAFTFSGTNETGPQWHATLVVGNLLGFVEDGGFEGGGDRFGALYFNQSNVIPGVPFLEPNTRVYFQDFAVAFDTSVWGQGFTAELGRIGVRRGNMFLSRYDNTPYFENARWDDGNWYMDGGHLVFGWGGVALNVWGGRTSHRFDSASLGSLFGPLGGEVWLLTAGTQSWLGFGDLFVDRTLGFGLDFGLGTMGDVMLNYMFMDADFAAFDPVGFTPYNRIVTWGGELNFNVTPNLLINGGYSQTDYMMNSSSVLTDENFAWWARAMFNVGAVGINLGWRHIEPWFGAAGDWDRMGVLWNVTDHEGFFGDISFGLGGNMNVTVGGFLYSGLDGMLFDPDAEILGINAELNFGMGTNWDIMLGWEHVSYKDLFGPGAEDARVNWYRVGLTHSMADGSRLLFKYEISDLRDEDFQLPFGDIRRGGFLTTQWSKRF